MIYLTDGNLNFLILHAAVRRIGTPAVVVGIGYPEQEVTTHRQRRAFDLTSAQSESFRKKFPAGGLVKQTGGNDQFLAFLESEVKPRVERRVSIDKGQQTLFGHSLGGAFALHVLLTKPAAFQTYLASSPSLLVERQRHPRGRERLRRKVRGRGEGKVAAHGRGVGGAARTGSGGGAGGRVA